MTPTPTDPTLVAAVLTSEQLRAIAEVFADAEHDPAFDDIGAKQMAMLFKRLFNYRAAIREGYEAEARATALERAGTEGGVVAQCTCQAATVRAYGHALDCPVMLAAADEVNPTPTAGTEGGEAEWAQVCLAKCVVCGQEIGANKAHYLGDDARGYVVPRSGPYHEACLPTPSAPSAPAPWDAKVFVQQFMEWRNYRSRPNIIALADAAHARGQTDAAGVGARVPEEMPEWFPEFMGHPGSYSYCLPMWIKFRTKLGGAT